jgi:hypothetical protein
MTNLGPLDLHTIEKLTDIRYDITLEFDDETNIMFNGIKCKHVKIYPPFYVKHIFPGEIIYKLDSKKLLVFVKHGGVYDLLVAVKL